MMWSWLATVVGDVVIALGEFGSFGLAMLWWLAMLWCQSVGVISEGDCIHRKGIVSIFSNNSFCYVAWRLLSVGSAML